MIRARSAFLLLLVIPALVLGAPARAASSDAAYNNGKILEFMNAERAARGVGSVSRDPTLDQKALQWAAKLAAEGQMYHNPTYAAQAAGYNSWAQNLAYRDDSMTAAQAHDMWMNSGIHRKNLLDPDFTHVGIAMACSTKSGRAYVMAVVEFGGNGNPSHDTPPRNPQVAGSSDPSRAMSCDGGAAPPTDPPPPAATAATAAVAPTSTSRPAAPSTRVSTAVRAVTTTRRATTSTVATSSTTSVPVAAALDTSTSTSPAPAADLAGAASERRGLGGWLWALLGLAAALVLMRVRRPRSGRHSIGR